MADAAALSSRPLGATPRAGPAPAGPAARPRRVPGSREATRPGFGVVSPGHATPAKVRSLRGPPIWSSRPFAIDTVTELGWDWKTCLCRWRGFGLCASLVTTREWKTPAGSGRGHQRSALVQGLTLTRLGFSPATLPAVQFLNA